MSRLTVTLLLLLLLITAGARTQNTMRRGLRPLSPEREAAGQHFRVNAAPSDSAIVLRGYDKARASARETFFVTNNCGEPIEGLCVTITYKDMENRMLHRRQERVYQHVPAGETRCAGIPTWDRQNNFYYHLSRKGSRSAASAYRVAIRVDSIITLNTTDE